MDGVKSPAHAPGGYATSATRDQCVPGVVFVVAPALVLALISHFSWPSEQQKQKQRQQQRVQ